MSNQPAGAQLLEGTPYRLVRPLGGGAMGDVWLGEHTRLRRPVVLKIIKEQYARDEHILGRFEREGRIVSNLRHDALVIVYDLGTAADGRTFMAMEYLEGHDFREHLRVNGALPAHEACRLLAQACEGLEAAHAVGVLHRDVKPENLFVTARGQLKVLDFGIAKPQDSDATGARTAAGLVLGTPRYMAPEQAMGNSLSPATDLYAIGCVLFEAIAGSPLFAGRDARDLLRQHLTAPPETLSARLGRPVDEQIEALLAQSLEKDPSRRLQRAAWMAEALRIVGAQLGPPDARASRAPSRIQVEASAHPTSAPPTDVDPVFDKPTVRVDLPLPRGAREDSYTRPVAAAALLAGVSTTERAPVQRTERFDAQDAKPPFVTGATPAPPGVVTTPRSAPGERLLCCEACSSSSRPSRSSPPPRSSSSRSRCPVTRTASSTSNNRPSPPRAGRLLQPLLPSESRRRHSQLPQP